MHSTIQGVTLSTGTLYMFAVSSASGGKMTAEAWEADMKNMQLERMPSKDSSDSVWTKGDEGGLLTVRIVRRTGSDSFTVAFSPRTETALRESLLTKLLSDATQFEFEGVDALKVRRTRRLSDNADRCQSYDEFRVALDGTLTRRETTVLCLRR